MRSRRSVSVLFALALTGCLEVPTYDLSPVSDALDAGPSVEPTVRSQPYEVPLKTKLDFLFVVDDSGSMCEEQANLARNFDQIADLLFEDLEDAADTRLAVVSTDMHAPNEKLGRFLSAPAAPVPTINCLDDRGEPQAPDTVDCEGLVERGELPSILKVGVDGNVGQHCAAGSTLRECVKADLELKFRCLVTLGTGGDGFEKGLEAMRIGLSCAGHAPCLVDGDCAVSGRCVDGFCAPPNRSKFDACCTADGAYDPACDSPQEPEFLRPDAALVVVFISDEDDCSDPATNPPASRRVICKHGSGDGDGDGVPDGYADAALCDGLDPEACFIEECGLPPDGVGPAEWAERCQTSRCTVSRSENSNCEWFRDDLVPVADYARFLAGLKQRPAQQLLVAAVVGHREYVQGEVITYNPGEPDRADCLSSHEDFEAARCCPDGHCLGRIQPSCQSGNGIAFAGRRYLELVEQISPRAPAGCPLGANAADPAQCVHICVDDFAPAIRGVRESVADLLGSVCLDRAPLCRAGARIDAEGDLVGGRACQSEAERRDPANYPVRVQVRCDGGAACPDTAPRELSMCRGVDCGDDGFQLFLEEAGCPGGALLFLSRRPSPGAEVVVDYLAVAEPD